MPKGNRNIDGLGLTNAKAPRKVSRKIETMYVNDLVVKTSGDKFSQVLPVSFTLKDLYPMRDLDDKFSEYKIENVEVSIVGFENPDDLNTIYNTQILICPHLNGRYPSDVDELLRSYGVRLFPAARIQNGVVTACKFKPVFDITGSANHYGNDFVEVANVYKTPWLGFVVAVMGPTTTTTTSWIVRCIIKARINFRGLQ